MDKKGHIYVAKLVTNVLEENDIEIKKNQKLANAFGSILPDIKPSFINTRHNMEETFDYFKSHLDKTIKRIEEVGKLLLFRLGEMFHYICDYFIYPHNPEIWKGSLIEHIKYEKEQHKQEFVYIREKAYQKDFKSFETNLNISENELINIIKDKHKIYLTEKRTVYTDCKYITCMLLLVLKWLFLKIFDINLKI